MDKATQRSKILAYCAEHGSITVREAFTQLGINSPTKRISEIRKSGGYKVEVIEERSGTTRWNRYFIAPVEGEENEEKN